MDGGGGGYNAEAPRTGPRPPTYFSRSTNYEIARTRKFGNLNWARVLLPGTRRFTGLDCSETNFVTPQKIRFFF